MEEGAVAVRADRFWDDVQYGPDGLVPVVAQSVPDGRILMLAWANREALRRTVVERRAHFWSRSRQSLWRKGETSGHALDVQRVLWDCDADAVIYQVRASGPACHTGSESCFFRGEDTVESAAPPGAAQAPAVAGLGATLDQLAAVIAQRQRTMPETSYVAGLLAAGPERALQKVGEEAVEAVLAGAALARTDTEGARSRAAAEFADLLFAALVALAAVGVGGEAVAAELQRRARSRPPRTE